ncbi:L-seryl-tRNA(Sec) selenium transferase [Clostridium sp. 1001271st1 H5]|uniref:L-seryl-tRNA(Sec) selenium transferase n=1 Tax=unclassified Clostridium TaxID=2614128 RepID=UPI00325B7DF6
MEDRRELLRKIPKIDEVLQDERLFFFTESTPRSVIVDSVREVIEELRKDILEGKRNQVGTKETLMTEIVARITGKKKKSLRRVINATGVVLHTNLGRANLSDKACESIMDVARNYTNLEYDVKRGSRGSRHDHVEKILTKITGAEAAMVVNNNAAATMLCLSALAKDKEVIVSRGELVEIGGSFRVPEIMEQSGAKLMDVGTTNKTKPSDYLNAYHEGETGALMKVHTSNYRILGFTQEVELPEMVELGKKLNLPVIYDMGSGLMADLTEYGVDEPTVLDALKTGIDVILFSGDKLLGGPQGGIIAGKKEYIDKMKAHPLARAFRVDKMTLAAMEATFFEYSDIRQARKTIPVLNMITTPAKELKDKAERLAEAIRGATHNFTVEVEACKDQVGGGSAPTVLLDGYAVAIQGRALTPEKIERLLRKEEIPIIVRITHNQVYLDVRTIREDEFEYIVAAFLAMDSRQVEG